MKFKVKFRISVDGGVQQKFSIQLEEGKPFVAGKAIPALTRNLGTLVVRQENLFLNDGKASGPFTVNGTEGKEFHLKVGDVLKAEEFTVEFLELPFNPDALRTETQFLDVSAIAPPVDSTQFVSITDADSLQGAANPAERSALPQEKPSAPESREPESTAFMPTSGLEERGTAARAATESFNSHASETRTARNESDFHERRSHSRDPYRIPERSTEVSRRVGERKNAPAVSSKRKTGDVTGMFSATLSGSFEARGEILTLVALAFVAFSVCSAAGKLGSPLLWGLAGGGGTLLLAWLMSQLNAFMSTRGSMLEYLRFFTTASFAMIPLGYSLRFSWIAGFVISMLMAVGFFLTFVAKFQPNWSRFSPIGGVVALVPALIVGTLEWMKGPYRFSTGQQPIVVESASGTPEPQRTIASGSGSAPEQPAQIAPAPIAPAPVAPANPPVAAQPIAAEPEVKAPPVAAVNPPAGSVPPSVAEPIAAAPQSVSQPVSQPANPAAWKSDGSVPDPLATEQFFTAVKTGNLSVVRSLITSKAVDPNFTLDRGATALMHAANHGQLAVAKFLVAQRVNINAQDPNGTTALMWAAYRGHEDIVSFLVSKGADLSIRRDDGDTVLDIARKWKQRGILKDLQEEVARRSIPGAAGRYPTSSNQRKGHSDRNDQRSRNRREVYPSVR